MTIVGEHGGRSYDDQMATDNDAMKALQRGFA
jgi:hypothetical protein